MIALLTLLARMAAGFAAGYLANDVVDIVTTNQAQRKLTPSGQAVPQIPLANALQRWMDRSFIMKFIIVVVLAVVTAIIFMTRVQRKKLLKL